MSCATTEIHGLPRQAAAQRETVISKGKPVVCYPYREGSAMPAVFDAPGCDSIVAVLSDGEHAVNRRDNAVGSVGFTSLVI